MILLIVDDEQEILTGLKDTIDWKSIGISSIYTAENGIEALNLAKSIRPDILLTDIRMPGMDGIELSCQLKEQYLFLKVFIISVYSDFKYAKRAISVGVEDYLIKPVNINELLEKVGKSVEKIRYERMLTECINSKISDVQSELISRLISKNIPLTDGFKEELKKVGIEFHFDNVLCLLMEVDDYYQFVQRKGNEAFADLIYAIEKKVRLEYFNNHAIIKFNLEKNNRLGFMINVSESDREPMIKDNIVKLHEKLQPILDYHHISSITFGVSKITGKYEFYAAYQSALNAIKYKFFLGKGHVIFASDLDLENKQANLPSLHAVEHILVKAVRQGNIDQALEVMQPLFEAYRASSPEHEYEIKNNFFKLLKILLGLSGYDKEGDINFEKLLEQPLQSLETLDDYINWIESLYIDKLVSSNIDTYSKGKWIVEKAKSYIYQNLQNDISIKDVADYVGRNPNYFCHYFKKEVGMSFTEFLNKARIEKAKQLLLDTSLMTYEIADKVGFYNFNYFSQVFKKLTGYTPTQYRNKYK